MRAFILLFCTSVFSFSSGDLLSQNSKIVIDTDTILTIDEVFDIIYKQTDYSFAYKSEIFKDVPSIELKKGSIKTNDLLNQILSKGNFNVVFGTNNTILIKEKEIDIKIEQGFQVSGIVTDFNGQSLAGANVLEKGTINGVQTDFNGKFSLNVTDQEAVLEISYLGFVTIEVLVDGQDNFSIVLQEDSEKLDEIVVVGYGIQRKKDLTGSISTVDGEVLSKRNVTQLSQALQGTMPGMMVTRSSDEPGESASVRVRGITTIGDNSPLFIVDGVPIDNINYVNPSNIESITVLKDAASASIYGARAAAGVILITTKRAKEGQINLEYTSNIGFDKPTAFIEKVGPQRYLEMINEWVWNDAGNTPGQEYALYAQEEVDNWISNNQSNPNQYPITDWQSLLLKRQANRQSHELVISAGGEKVNTRASVKYEDIGALYNHRSFTRILTRVNNSIEITDNLSAEVDFSHNYTHNTEPMVNPVWNALSYAPIYAAQWDDGRIAGGKNGDNAYAMLNYGGNDDYWVNNINGRLGLTFKPTKNLSFTARVAPNLKSTKYKTFRKQIEYYSENDPTQFGGFISGFNATNLSERRVDSYNLTKQFLVNYEKSFNVHNVNTMIGYEDFYAFNESVGAIGRNFELNSYPYLDLAPVDFITASGYANENSYRSFFGRATYDYKSKYFIQGNLRLDGSSRFHQDYRWGYFPSVSAGWAISEESFMQNLTSISFLKIRGSWGNMGNERIGNYPYQSNINFSNGLFYQGNDVVSATTAAQVDYAIQDISWETTETFDVGLDLQLFKNKFTLNADYYKKTTKGMLLDLEIPDYIGFSNPTQNAGEMYTTGWDFNVSWKEVVNDLSYTISLNLSDSKTKMGGLSGIVFDGSTIIREGSEFNEWYGYKSDGIFQTQEEVDNSALLNSSVQPGDIKYLDVSGPDGEPDGVISPDYDRVLLGGSLPRYLYGGTIDLNYKGFDFSLAVQGVGMQNSYLNSNLTKPFVGQWHNVSKIVDGNYWSHYNTPEENLKATYPRLSYTSESANYSTSDFWLINGAYFRLKNIVLGYTFPESTFSQVKLKSIRVYGSVNDLFTISHFPDGWDPESAYDSLINTTINLGISVKF
ncbi:SusC/RagA family TonB-linked outer membrane protein [Pseudalgibacter alginicilyticus]|nr:TonB-dependent receptor [Pseudalgibacter alginicilyticus]